MSAGLHIYGARDNGARAVGVDVADGVTVLVTPIDGQHNEAALVVARDTHNAGCERAALRAELDHARRTHERLSKRIRELEAQRDAAEERAIAATYGRRRFFGPVLLVPARPGDWSGEVWLLDPIKRERGRALVFASVAEVRALHPELWMVEVRDGGVLLDAWGSARADADDALRRAGSVDGEARRHEAAGE